MGALSFVLRGAWPLALRGTLGRGSFDIHRVFGWWHATGASLRVLLRTVAHHTGLPVVVVAAIALVVSWRALKRGVRFVVEVAFALAALFVATRLGWIRW